mgnify:CR=1 FL=1
MTDYNAELYHRIVTEIIEPKLNKYDAKDVLAGILDEYKITKAVLDPKQYDLKANIEKYLTDKKHQGLSDLTIMSYSLQLDIFAEKVEKPVNEITKDDIKSFLVSRENDPGVNAKSTVETVRSILRSFFEWLEEERIIDENPMLRIKPYKLAKPMAKALTVEELEVLRESCITLREKALIETLYSTGCRLSEVSELNKSNIDWQNRTISVWGKGSKERLVFFSARAAIYLQKYLDSRSDDCDALFVTERRPYRRMSNRAIQREVSNVGERANLGKSIHPHVLRHTFATLMLNKGCPMSVVQELLGHDDLATTQTYAKVTHEHKQHSYQKYFHQ